MHRLLENLVHGDARSPQSIERNAHFSLGKLHALVELVKL